MVSKMYLQSQQQLMLLVNTEIHDFHSQTVATWCTVHYLLQTLFPGCLNCKNADTWIQILRRGL